MKYKIGDKVRVRKDLEPGNFYGRVYYSSNMNKFKAMECVDLFRYLKEKGEIKWMN